MNARPLFVLRWSVLLTMLTVVLGCEAQHAGSAAPQGTPQTTSTASTATATIVTTAPDDYDPVAAKLAREAAVHRMAPPGPLPLPSASASASPAASAVPSEPVVLPSPVVRPWSEAGVLVLILANQEVAQATASSLRWEFSHNGGNGAGGAGAWANAVDAIHVYERLWVTRVSPVNEQEARALCAWLNQPRPKDPSWLARDLLRTCRFSSKPTITSKTEYVLLSDAH